MSLRNKFVMMILAVLVSSLVMLGLITLHKSQVALRESVGRELSAISNDISNQIAAANLKEFSIIRVLADTDIMKSNEASLREKCSFLTSCVLRMGSRYENLGYYDLDGNSISRDGREINLSGKDYIQRCLKGEDVIVDPFVSSVTNTQLMQYGIPVRDTDNRIIGCMVIILNGNPMETLVRSIDLGDGMHPSIINRRTGKTTADGNDTNDGRAGEGARLDDSSGLGLAMKRILQGEDGFAEFTDPFSHRHITSAFLPIADSDWSVFCAASYDYYFAPLKELKRVLVLIMAVVVIVSALVCGMVIAALIKPLFSVKHAVLELSSGNADLTRRLTASSDDEIGDVVTGVNQFIQKLHDIMVNIKASEKGLSSVDDELQVSTADTASCITQLTSHIETVKANLKEQSGSVIETADSVNEIASNIESLEHMIESQSSSVTMASSCVEQMIGTIGSVNDAVEKMVSSFSLLEHNTAEGINTQSDANGKIRLIEEQSKMLQDANTAIASIAEQTNLLAMNAAIEAAHAGEAGKGFSVVADEIRKLSETSSSQSRSIGDELKKIQESIEEVVSASAATNAAFSSVSASISETSRIMQQIRSAMEEQHSGSRQIIDALKSMNDSTVEVRASSAEMTEGNRHILSEIRKLQDVSAVMEGSMQEMTASIQRMHGTGGKLSDISGKMNRNIKKIGEEINQFKI